jgi:hypothetical protein
VGDAGPAQLRGFYRCGYLYHAGAAEFGQPNLADTQTWSCRERSFDPAPDFSHEMSGGHIDVILACEDSSQVWVQDLGIKVVFESKDRLLDRLRVSHDQMLLRIASLAMMFSYRRHDRKSTRPRTDGGG